MTQTYPGFDSAEQRDDYRAALEAELSFLKARKNPRAKEVEAELAKLKPARSARGSKTAAAEDETDDGGEA